MNVFGPFGLSGNSSLEEVNQYLNERRLEEETNPLALDTSLFLLIDDFKRKVENIGIISLPCSLLDVKRIKAKANQIFLRDTQKKH